PHFAGAVPTRAPAPDRDPCRLRYLAMRRLRGSRRRQGGEVLHRVRLAARRRQRHHDRGPRRAKRAAASDAGGFPRAPRAAMRLLHPGHAHFVRSPHAHARIKRIDTAAASARSGVLAVLTGTELAADKIGNLICGWMIHSKDGSPMKMAPHPALAHDKANHVGDPVAVVVAETLAQAKDAAEHVKVDYEVLPAVADPAQAQANGAPQIHEVAPANTIY